MPQQHIAAAQGRRRIAIQALSYRKPQRTDRITAYPVHQGIHYRRIAIKHPSVPSERLIVADRSNRQAVRWFQERQTQTNDGVTAITTDYRIAIYAIRRQTLSVPQQHIASAQARRRITIHPRSNRKPQRTNRIAPYPVHQSIHYRRIAIKGLPVPSKGLIAADRGDRQAIGQFRYGQPERFTHHTAVRALQITRRRHRYTVPTGIRCLRHKS